MRNNDRNERILQSLETKIAMEKFRKSSLEKDTQKEIVRPYFVLKVASVIAIIGIVSGNIYTYATYKKDMFSVVLEKIGMLSEYQNERKDVNITNDSEGYKLTLTDYGIDEDTLIIGYDLELAKKIENKIRFFDNSKISDGDKVWKIDTNSNIETFTKITDTKYRVYKFYKMDTSKLSENVEFSTDIKLYEELDELHSEELASWSFKVNLENDKLNLEHEKYLVKNKETEIAKILEVSKTNLSTKITILLKRFIPEPGIKYYVEILDSDGNIILENRVEALFGGTPIDIILGKIDFDKRLIINIYETYENSNEMTKMDTLMLDLAKDLSEKSEQDVQRESKTFRDIEFKYIKGSEMDEETYNEGMGDEETYYFGVKLYSNIGDTNVLDDIIMVGCRKNLYNEDLETVVESINKLEYLGGYGISKEYTIFAAEDNIIKEDVVLSHKQMMDLADGKDVNVDGTVLNKKMLESRIHDIKIEDKRNTKIDTEDAITWLETFGEDCRREYVFLVNGYIYQVSCPIDFDNIYESEEFVESIRINK